jgi:spermidine synthase
VTERNSKSRLRPANLFPLLVVLFAGSGCAALIYEIVWFQLLQLVIGSSAVSLAVLLATFMGGLCAGSLAGPRIAALRRHPLQVYALLEAGIAALGIILLFSLPYAGGLYTSIGGGIFVRALICGICLLPPAFLMGATLPVVARWVENTPRGISWLGFFYGSNIAGAVVGSLLAGFYLLRLHDMMVATFVAAGLNVLVAAVSAVAALYDRRGAGIAEKPAVTDRRYSSETAVYLAIALSGMTALGAQVIWTRVLSLMLGATVYTFSIILAIFLLGMGIGSAIGSMRSRSSPTPRRDLGICQMLLIPAIAWAAFLLTQSLPYWPVNPTLSKNAWLNFQLDMFRAAWVILPGAFLWGASFPLAISAAKSPDEDPAGLVGGIYAANTLGAIAGALGFSLVVTEWFGTQQALQVLILLSAASALLLLLRRVSLAAIAVVLAAVCLISISPVPGALIAYGRFLPRTLDLIDPLTKDFFVPNIIYAGEGLNASVAVSQMPAGVRNFHVSGKIEASTEPQDMRLQRMLGHIPALFHSNPRSVLVVGFGSGVTAGSFAVHPSVERIVICEIEPLIPQVASTYFGKENYNVLQDARVEVIYDDARHYILTTNEKFDVITSDPIHPWVKGSASLYTQEYFELAKRHLNPGGIISQWVPLYDSNIESVKTEIATFFEVFQNGTIWANEHNAMGYDLVLLGNASSSPVSLDDFRRQFDRPENVNVKHSLQAVGMQSAGAVLATYAGQQRELASWLAGAEINRDRNLRLQYLAGMGVNSSRNWVIYEEIKRVLRNTSKTN